MAMAYRAGCAAAQDGFPVLPPNEPARVGGLRSRRHIVAPRTRRLAMDTDRMVDVPAGDPAWRHATAADADGLELHYVRWGEGMPRVLLLHGWPGFWYDWRRVLPRLEPSVSVVALDFRGF